MTVIYTITYQIPLLQDDNTTSIPAMDIDENMECTQLSDDTNSSPSKPSSSEPVVKDILKESTQLTEDTNSSSSKPLSSFIKDIPKGTTPMTEDANSKSLDYFLPPKPCDLDLFFQFHPQKKSNDSLVLKVFYCSNGTERNWLTYNENKHALHCTMCMAFGKITFEINDFITGMTDWKHVHQKIQRHEQNAMHRECADAYFLRESKADIQNLLNVKQMSVHRKQVQKRRQLFECIIDIIKFIGKRGISYRGARVEQAYTLNDSNIDHGNFLELVILLSKYDVCMNEHLTQCIAASEKHHIPNVK